MIFLLDPKTHVTEWLRAFTVLFQVDVSFCSNVSIKSENKAKKNTEAKKKKNNNNNRVMSD